MGRFIYNWRSPMATHQPVLLAAAEHVDGPIAELGCGHGSTRLLHEVARRRGLRLVSLDNNAEWLERFRGELESPLHEFRLVDDWRAELERPEWRERWGLVFVDNDPWEARGLAVEKLRDVADFLIVHDVDHAARQGFIGRMIRDVASAADRGERDYAGVFSSWREFFPPEPWPAPATGPPTLLGSNRRDVAEIPVDFARHLPRWWPIARHARRWIPQSLRMRLGNLIGWRVRPRLR